MFLCTPWFLLEKIRAMFMLNLITQLISYCIMFETNKCIYRNAYLRGCIICIEISNRYNMLECVMLFASA